MKAHLVPVCEPGHEPWQPQPDADGGLVGVDEGVVVGAAVVAQPDWRVHLLRVLLVQRLEDVDGLCKEEETELIL